MSFIGITGSVRWPFTIGRISIRGWVYRNTGGCRRFRRRTFV